VYDELQRTGGALRHIHQPRAGRQLHPGSSPLGDVRQARVAPAAGVSVLWLETGMGLKSSMNTTALPSFRLPYCGKWSGISRCAALSTVLQAVGTLGCCAAHSGSVWYDRRQRPAVKPSVSGYPTQESHCVGDGNLVEWSMLVVGRRRRASRPDRRRCGSSPPSYSAQRTSLEWYSSSSYQAFQVGGCWSRSCRPRPSRLLDGCTALLMDVAMT
jgi:hypothetical protein